MRDDSMNMEKWMTENLSPKQIADMATYGVDAGWAGLAQYADLGKLYHRFQEEIWEALVEDAEALGYDNPLAMITTTFDKEVLNDIRSAEQFQNQLFWYVVRRTLKKLAN